MCIQSRSRGKFVSETSPPERRAFAAPLFRAGTAVLELKPAVHVMLILGMVIATLAMPDSRND
jgi:hypothetical protein